MHSDIQDNATIFNHSDFLIILKFPSEIENEKM